LRALIINLRAGRIVEGGSTITQQLSKVLFLTPKRTLIRKIREILLALKIERKYSKEEILELYFNQIYYGHGAYGVEAASRLYFGKHAEDLNLPECALIVGLTRSPNRYSPYRNPELARKRRSIVLARMKEVGFITPEEDLEARESSLNLSKYKPPPNKAPYFVEYIRQQLEKTYGSEILYRGGLQVYTTLDLRMQEAAQKALKKETEKMDKGLGYIAKESFEEQILEGKVKELTPQTAVVSLEEEKEGVLFLENPQKSLVVGDNVRVKATDKYSPEGEMILTLAQRPHLQGALIALEPQTGQIRAMVGGYNFYDDFNKGKFNRATQARRQPGSAFKPFVYTTAIDRGYTAASTIFDSPIIFKKEKKEKDEGEEEKEEEDNTEPEEEYWIPGNYKEKFHGRVTLRKMLAKSINVASIKLLQKVGVRRAIRYAHKMGIKSSLSPDLTLALGSSGVTPLEITAGYATIANLGVRVTPFSIRYIEDYSGKMLEENAPRAEAVLSPQTSYVMINLLQGVVENGTGQRIRWLGFERPVAGKTGTTNNFVNAWFIGFTPNLACGVYVGYDNMLPLGENMTGSRAAIPIWTQFMKEALEGKPVEDFLVPPGITFAKIEANSGLLATDECRNIIEEVFLKGKEPTRYFNIQEKPEFIESFLRFSFLSQGQ
jgi:penicillin-binding protein 1A